MFLVLSLPYFSFVHPMYSPDIPVRPRFTYIQTAQSTSFHRKHEAPILAWQLVADDLTVVLVWQMVVEKMLEQQGSSRQAIGREAFTQKVWEWKEQYGGFISQQLRSLGASCDWSRERFTLDTPLSSEPPCMHQSLFLLFNCTFPLKKRSFTASCPCSAVHCS